MKKVFLASLIASMTVTAGIGLAGAPVLLAQAPASGDITIKDPAEFNAYQNIQTQTSPAAKASASESFLTTYPQSVVKKSVLLALLQDYAAAQPNDPAKTQDAAKRVLQVDPNNLLAMYMIAYIDKQLAGSNQAQQAQLLDDAAANAQKGLAATKPAEVSDEDFKKQKSTTDPFFHSIIAYDDELSKKDYKAAIEEFRAELQSVPPDATKQQPALGDTLQLGVAYTKLDPPDMVNAVWFLARAQNFAPDNFKPQIEKQAKYWYKRFHGKEDGYDQVLAQAATSVFPPDGFKIDPAPTPKDIADGVVTSTPDLSTLALGDKEYILANASHDNAEKLWTILKDQTTQVPGTVLAVSDDHKQLQIAVTEDAKTDKKPDFTVNMKEAIPDADLPAVGSEETTLIGTYDSYTQSPAMIIMRDGELQIEHKKAPARKPSAAHHTTRKPS
ncbi:MAG TPA: hypothetical protein VL346_02695 [Acidobacteriaceae bacterium]|nr:hypothetical protein [Acidobacteriaceae bacterium]